MKTLLIAFWCFFFTATVFSQTKPAVDVVTMTNGTEHKGKVTKINTDAIVFVYEGETLEYTFKKPDIFSIQFASGRKEIFTTIEKGDSSTGTSDKIETQKSTNVPKNSVAILPFRYITNTNSPLEEEKNLLIQEECFRLANENPGVYTYQQTGETNSMLRKKGITTEMIRSYQANELCEILGVEYVILGTVTLNKKGTIFNTSTNTNKQTTTKNDKKTINPNTTTTTTSSTSTVSDEYETILGISIFDNHGKSIYDRSRKSFFSSPDAYKSTLSYLMKRIPFYSK